MQSCSISEAAVNPFHNAHILPFSSPNGGVTMPKPLRSSADVPEFDTYPAGVARIEPERELPPAMNPRLERNASKVGSAVGGAVATVRELPKRFQELPDRMNELG